MTTDRERAERRVKAGTCEGACHPHLGEVRMVRVWHGTTDWGLFAYCQAARWRDRDRGLTVTEA